MTRRWRRPGSHGTRRASRAEPYGLRLAGTRRARGLPRPFRIRSSRPQGLARVPTLRDAARWESLTRAVQTFHSLYRRYPIMARCEVCGNEYDKTFEVVKDRERHTFDSFECAIHALAPICEHCGCRII